MEAITNRMMDLNGERQQDFFILVIVFSKREHGRKKFRMLATLTLKLLKLTHGISDMKIYSPGTLLWASRQDYHHSEKRLLHKRSESDEYSRRSDSIMMKTSPSLYGKGYSLMNLIPYYKLIILYGHTEFRMPVYDVRNKGNNRRIKFPANLFDML